MDSCSTQPCPRRSAAQNNKQQRTMRSTLVMVQALFTTVQDLANPANNLACWACSVEMATSILPLCSQPVVAKNMLRQIATMYCSGINYNRIIPTFVIGTKKMMFLLLPALTHTEFSYLGCNVLSNDVDCEAGFLTNPSSYASLSVQEVGKRPESARDPCLLPSMPKWKHEPACWYRSHLAWGWTCRVRRTSCSLDCVTSH